MNMNTHTKRNMYIQIVTCTYREIETCTQRERQTGSCTHRQEGVHTHVHREHTHTRTHLQKASAFLRRCSEFKHLWCLPLYWSNEFPSVIFYLLRFSASWSKTIQPWCSHQLERCGATEASYGFCVYWNIRMLMIGFLATKHMYRRNLRKIGSIFQNINTKGKWGIISVLQISLLF